MSTEFDVIPGTNTIPTIGEVLARAELLINQYLEEIGAKEHITLRAEFFTPGGRRPARLDELFIWPQATYQGTDLWLTIAGTDGGTDVYCRSICDAILAPDNPWFYLDGIREAPNYQRRFDDILATAKRLDRIWSFRRSAGQPAIIVFSYGIIASVLAEMTEGLVYSDDSAWFYSRLPQTGAQFRAEYFRVEDDSDKNIKVFIEGCIGDLKHGGTS